MNYTRHSSEADARIWMSHTFLRSRSLTTYDKHRLLKDMRDAQTTSCAGVVCLSFEAVHRIRLSVLGLKSCYYVKFCI
ncbi:hypothetical protein M758_UG093200 [Ceratodon purpureus]|nr:hypothetical protein M758_UG092500 [Ceratodon purpureus]KAG0594614.1 hypothetical protein M758_UG093200 [Ceratodon purpureus]